MKLYVFIFCILVTLYNVQFNYANESHLEEFKNEVLLLKSNLSLIIQDIENAQIEFKSLANSNMSALAKNWTLTVQMLAQGTVNNISKYVIENEGKEADPKLGDLCREEAKVKLLSINTKADMKILKCFKNGKRISMLYITALKAKQYVVTHLNTDLHNLFYSCFGNNSRDCDCNINSLKDIKDDIEANTIKIPEMKNEIQNAIYNAIAEQHTCNSDAESVAREELDKVQPIVAKCLGNS